MAKIIYTLILCSTLVSYSCQSQDGGSIAAEAERLDLFDRVWNTVDEQFFDPRFNGVDWQAVGTRYRPLVARCTHADSLFGLLNRMLFELNSSHCGIGPLSKLERNVSPYLFMPGTIGIDVRVLDNEIVVVKVLHDSPAGSSALKTGYVIEKIDGLSLSDIRKTTHYKPPFNKRNRKFHLTTEILRQLYGEPGTTVEIEYLDGDDASKSVSLQRRKRTDGITLVDWMPPLFIESESFFLTDDVAYLRFNAFRPEDPGRVIDDLESVSSAKSLIIDLRGNDGGSVEAMKGLLGRFVPERAKYGTHSNRYESIDDVIEPAGEIFRGKVVVLVDEMSISGAENTAGIMQLLGLAKIVGNWTPGQLLWGNSYLINDTISLVVPIYGIEYINGFIPENRGIEPDTEVELNRIDILQGKDTQLETAIDMLSEELRQLD